MIELTSEEKFLFLEAFTKELIRSSFRKVGLFQIQKLIDEKDGIYEPEVKVQNPEERRELIKKIVEFKEKEREEMVSSLHELSRPVGFSESLSVPKKTIAKKSVLKIPKVLKVPEPRLPLRLNYLRPVKTSEEIDLGKLNPFIHDLNVFSLETEGPGRNVFVSGKMGNKKTGVILTKEEIDKIVNDFSVISKIPLSVGINKMAFGKLILNATISEKGDKRFILTKIVESSDLIPKQGFASTPEVVHSPNFVRKRKEF